jgi:hypothetical protein
VDLGVISLPPCFFAFDFRTHALDSCLRPVERFVRLRQRLMASPHGVTSRGPRFVKLPLALVGDPLTLVRDPLTLVRDPLTLVGGTTPFLYATHLLLKLAAQLLNALGVRR